MKLIERLRFANSWIENYLSDYSRSYVNHHFSACSSRYLEGKSVVSRHIIQNEKGSVCTAVVLSSLSKSSLDKPLLSRGFSIC